MDTIVQFKQEQSLGAMDTSPTSAVMIHSFLATQDSALHPQSDMHYMLDQVKSEVHRNSASQQMHIPIAAEFSMPHFLDSPMDAIEVPLQQPLLCSAGFVPVDPFTLVAHPNNVDLPPDGSLVPIGTAQDPGINSSFSRTGAPLEAATDSSPVLDGRSRANASLSPQSVASNSSSLSPPRLQSTPTIDHPSTASNSSVDEADSQSPPRAVIGRLLKDIAKTAIDAGNASQGVQQATKVGELRDRVVQVLDMLAHLSVANGEAPIVAQIPSQLLMREAVWPADPPVESPQLSSTSDHPRKRCASELEERRVVKALKREPDDAPLSAILHEEYPVHANPNFAVPAPRPTTFQTMYAFPVGPASQPPSRAPSPPGFPTTNNFKPSISLSATTFAPLATGGTPLPPSQATIPNAAVPPFPPMPHAPWSDSTLPTSRRQHSLSLGSANGPQPASSSGLRPVIPPSGLSNGMPQNASGSTIGRMSRSGSVSGTNFRSPYAKPAFPETHPDAANWHKARKPATRNGLPSFFFGSESVHPRTSSGRNFQLPSSEPVTAHNSPSDDEDDDDDSESDEDYGPSEVTSSTQAPGSASAATDMPPEFRADVDRIFFEFLNKLCSNLDATCSKGEQIHQTLMAKKMQRLDESPDFRPFKFRILAFTNAFMDVLAEQGFPEDRLPMKKVRNYLWRQQYILRFNEDGKKAKSKGNHIWSIEAKKGRDGKWEFRPFHRKLAGPPPVVAYTGLRWAWKPRIWDPQISFKKIQVTYSSPSLPPWLLWKNGELSGVPPADAETCHVTAVAQFVLDGQDTELPHTFTISIAPVSALDGSSYSRSRRPSFPGGESVPKRSTSDSALSSAPQRLLNSRARVDDRAVIQVLQNVAQRVTDEAESQFVAASPPKQGAMHALVKQKHVLEQTVNAYDKALSGQGHLQARRLAVAAQHVVLQAAQTIVADKTVAVGGVPTPEMESVSMHELTDKTQDAIAMAVKMNGPASNEVDIIVTATSILKQSTAVTPPTIATRHPMASPSAAPRISSAFPPSATLSTLPEHV